VACSHFSWVPVSKKTAAIGYLLRKAYPDKTVRQHKASGYAWAPLKKPLLHRNSPMPHLSNILLSWLPRLRGFVIPRWRGFAIRAHTIDALYILLPTVSFYNKYVQHSFLSGIIRTSRGLLATPVSRQRRIIPFQKPLHLLYSM